MTVRQPSPHAPDVESNATQSTSTSKENSVPPSKTPKDVSDRVINIERTTQETSIKLRLDLDGQGKGEVNTGIGFLDHMLLTLTKHARFNLVLSCQGDLHVDDHHTVEDCALVIGQALDAALGERRGIQRFGSAYAPLDEALVRCVVDLSGRPWPQIDLRFKRERLGQLATENITHFFQSLAMAGRMNLHLQLLTGDNDHHKSEAGFKATALALRAAIRRDGFDDVPSAKGVLT